MKYSSYTLKDFILDDYFITWVQNPDQQSDHFWQKFQEQHPEKVIYVREAREFVLKMKFNIHSSSFEEYEAEWHKLSESIENYEEGKSKTLWPYWKGVAASIAILMAFVTLYFIKVAPSEISISTQFGEIKTIELPDHSIVTLNANSNISYSTGWDSKTNREVRLNGEAFFEIQKKKTGQKFLVHTSDLAVEVLGTKFNVNSRRRLTQVVLNEGKVMLNINKSSFDTTMIMQIGDMVEFSKSDQNLKKQFVDPDKYSAWKNKEWILDNLSLKEVAMKIEETYGVKVEIQNTNLPKETVTGAVPTENLDVLLKALEISFKVKITHRNNLIIIKP